MKDNRSKLQAITGLTLEEADHDLEKVRDKIISVEIQIG